MAQRNRRRLSGQLPKRMECVTGPRQVIQIGRNEPCPCGSSKKYKDCHLSEGEAYLAKLKAERQRLKDAGVPWYRRLFMLR